MRKKGLLFEKRSKNFCVLAVVLVASSAAGAEQPTGKAIFDERCALCHQSDAHGAPGVAPSLAGTLAGYTNSSYGKEYLAQILLSGMVGKIQTEGHSFSGLMPSFQADLSDSDIAGVVNYVLSNFNAIAKPVITPQDVTVARARNPVATDTRHLREKILAGGT